VTLRAAFALLACVACRPQPSAPRVDPGIAGCRYQLLLEASGIVRVDASCKSKAPVSFRVAEPYVARDLQGASPNRSGRYETRQGQISYRVDLASMAARTRDFDHAAHVGGSFFAPMSSVLLVPEPLTTEIPVEVRVSVDAGASYAVGLARGSAPDTYRLMAHEIPVATYFAFGKLEQRVLEIGGARLEVSKLDGALAESQSDIDAWIRASAGAVGDFYGVFPVPRASVTILPAPGKSSVVFGKVLPESEPGIALLLGQFATKKSLYSDWILVHELYHLGFPSFNGEGKWLDEGLATYYEPIIRVRAGLYTETELWDEFTKNMPQGMPAFTGHGLERADDFRGIYWGGAIACLVADVTARKRRLETGLEVGLRALREAGGNACEVWSLSEAIGAIDHALGAPTLAPIAQAHANHGAPYDLNGLFRDLGVTRDAAGKLALYDDDGETFDFEKGQSSWTTLEVAKSATGEFAGKITPDANGQKWSYGEVTWTMMPTK